MDYVTLGRDDADYDRYLMGTFSSTARALPIETSHVRAHGGRVTFRVVDLESLEIPRWWTIYFFSARPDLLALTLGPALVTWLSHRVSPAAWERPSAWGALLGIFFFHVAAFLMNDVQDHVRGTDRLNRRRGSRVIQKGWTTAAAMRRWALVNAGLGALCGGPAFTAAPLPLAVILSGAGLALFMLTRNLGARWGACDLATILLFGPLLTCGVAFSSFGEAGPSDVGLGVAFGLATLWVLQTRQFENLFRADPESFRTFLGHLNFDGARRAVVTEGVALLAVVPSAAVVVRVPLLLLAVVPFFALPLVFFIQRVSRASSPLASDLVGANRRALISHGALTAWWILAVAVAWL